MCRCICGLFVALVVGLSASTACAQKYFIFPAYGGTVAYPFNDTHAASPGKYHTGVDIWGPGYGSTYVLASSIGRVHAITLNGNNDHGFGNCVILKHDVIVSTNGATAPYYTLYGHLATITTGLKAGQFVGQGQIIGTMGSSGYGMPTYWGKTPHLHFEVKIAGLLENPYGGGPYWGYTPKPAQNYGYVDPAAVIGRWWAK